MCFFDGGVSCNCMAPFLPVELREEPLSPLDTIGSQFEHHRVPPVVAKLDLQPERDEYTRLSSRENNPKLC
jgi:hypothetical protein